MIVEVYGYKFPTQAIADAYVEVVDKRYGLPNGETLHYFQYASGTYQGDSFFWTNADDGLIPDLGQPYNFFIENDI